MTFRASFCHPFQPAPIELGPISKEEIITAFNKTPWQQYLQQMEVADEASICFSPSLEIEWMEEKAGLCFSAVAEKNGYSFIIFFKRPKANRDYISEIADQSSEEALACLDTLLNGNLAMLEGKIKPSE